MRLAAANERKVKLPFLPIFCRSTVSSASRSPPTATATATAFVDRTSALLGPPEPPSSSGGGLHRPRQLLACRLLGPDRLQSQRSRQVAARQPGPAAAMDGCLSHLTAETILAKLTDNGKTLR